MRPRGSTPAWLRLLGQVGLRAYPPALRRRYRREMLEALEHRWRKEQSVGRGATWRTARWIVQDLVSGVPREWAHTLRRDARAEASGAVLGGFRAFGREVAQAFRSLRRRPALAVLVVGTLALGIGANLAIYSVLDRSVLRPLPAPDAGRMAYVLLTHRERGFQRSPSPEEVEVLSAGGGVLERMEFFRTSRSRWSGDGDPEFLSTLEISLGLADMLGVEPVLGRGFDEDDARVDSEPVIMLREAFWRARYAGDSSVLGRTLTLDDRSYRVVGIWPDQALLNGGGDEPPAVIHVLPEGEEVAPGHFTIPLVLLADGVRPRVAADRLNELAEQRLDRGLGAWTVSVTGVSVFLGNELKTGLWLTYLGVGLLLLVAIANVANLMIGRAVGRRRELGVRLALGASPLQVVRVFLAEGLVLALAGTASATLLARWSLTTLETLAPPSLGLLRPADIDLGIMAYTLALGVGTTLLIALPPALGRGADRAASLVSDARTRGPTRVRLESGLLTAQVALAMILVSSAGLAFRGLHRLTTVDTGYDLDRILQVAVGLPSARYPTPEAREAFNAEVLAALEALPAVERVTISGNSPFAYSLRLSVPYLERSGPGPETGESTSVEGVLPGYFETVGIPVLRGRVFTLDDARAEAPPVVVVNEAFDRLSGGSVVGERLRFPGDSIGQVIVGVVADVRSMGLADTNADRVQLYYPRLDTSQSYLRYLIRTSADPAELALTVRRRLAELDPALPLSESVTGADMVREQTAQHRFLSLLLGAFGILGACLALTGVYGVVSLGVSRGTAEIGVRMALGAGHVPVVREVVANGLRPVLAGVGLGVVGALASSRLLSAVLYEARPTDIPALGGAAAILVCVGLAATAVPARRASRVDPMIALREE